MESEEEASVFQLGAQVTPDPGVIAPRHRFSRPAEDRKYWPDPDENRRPCVVNDLLMFRQRFHLCRTFTV